MSFFCCYMYCICNYIYNDNEFLFLYKLSVELIYKKLLVYYEEGIIVKYMLF